MENTTRTKIMEAAEQLLRTRGYSDFSYADLVEQAGIRKPSIHHHFPTKEDLGVAIVSDYLVNFKATLDDTLVCQPTAGGPAGFLRSSFFRRSLRMAHFRFVLRLRQNLVRFQRACVTRPSNSSICILLGWRKWLTLARPKVNSRRLQMESKRRKYC